MHDAVTAPVKRSPLPRRVGVLVAALAAMSPLSAGAQSAADADRAEKLFAEASTLAATGKFAEACPKFEESQRLDRGLGTQFNLALCFEKLGRLGSAWRNFRGVARTAHETGKTGREEAALQKMKALRKQVSRLVITTHDADATLKVDGELVERDSYSFYAIDAGEHLVEATAPAKKSFQSKITVANVAANGEAVDQHVVIAALTADTRFVTVTKETFNPRRTAGIVVGGIGIVGLGAGLATGIALLNDKAIAEDRCQPTCSDESARDAVKTGKTLIPINVIAWSVGIAGVGVGAFLLLTSGTSKTTTTARITPLLGPDGGGASVVGTF